MLRARGRGRPAAPGPRVGRARRGALRRAGRAPRAARRPRRARDPARRRPRLHRARLPARHARARRHPAGRLRARAVPAVQPRLRAVVRDLRQRHALRARRADPASRRAAWPARCACTSSPTRRPSPACAATCALTGLPALLPAVGLRLLEVARRLRAPGGRRGGRPRLPLARHPARRDRPRLAVGDAIQHVGAQSAPVPGLRGDGRALARDRRAHGRVGHAVGQPRVARRPDPARPRLARGCTARRRPTTRRARQRFVRDADGEPYVARWWMGTGSLVDFTDPESRGVVARAGACARCAWAWRASRPTTARATTSARTCASPTGRPARRPRGATAACTGARCSARSTRPTAPARGVLFGRSGWSGQQATGDAVGGRPGVGLLVAAHARVLRPSRPPAAASRTGRTTSAATSATAASSAARRSCWCAGCSSAASRRSCRPTAGSSRSRGPTTPRRSSSTAATCCCTRCSTPTCAPRRPARRAAGRRSSAPPRCWTPAAGRSPTRSGSGPRCGSRRSSRRARASARRGCRRGEWIEAWSGARVRGGREVAGAGAAARDPGVGARGRDRRHPPGRLASRAGLGEGDAPLHATLWGEPRCGRALARLADGTVVRWRRGRWSAHGRADVTFSER